MALCEFTNIKYACEQTPESFWEWEQFALPSQAGCARSQEGEERWDSEFIPQYTTRHVPLPQQSLHFGLGFKVQPFLQQILGLENQLGLNFYNQFLHPSKCPD